MLAIKIPKSIAIFSDNDPHVSIKYADDFKKNLNSKIIIKHEMGHFSGPVDNEESCLILDDAYLAAREITK